MGHDIVLIEQLSRAAVLCFAIAGDLSNSERGCLATTIAIVRVLHRFH